MLADFYQSSALNKLWIFPQASAPLCCLIVAVHPLLHARPQSLLWDHLLWHHCAFMYGSTPTSNTFGIRNSLGLEARRRRRHRIPVYFTTVASAQFVAAVVRGQIYGQDRGVFSGPGGRSRWSHGARRFVLSLLLSLLRPGISTGTWRKY
jgi:hypothetical protein